MKSLFKRELSKKFITLEMKTVCKRFSANLRHKANKTDNYLRISQIDLPFYSIKNQ